MKKSSQKGITASDARAAARLMAGAIKKIGLSAFAGMMSSLKTTLCRQQSAEESHGGQPS